MFKLSTPLMQIYHKRFIKCERFSVRYLHVAGFPIFGLHFSETAGYPLLVQPRTTGQQQGKNPHKRSILDSSPALRKRAAPFTHEDTVRYKIRCWISVVGLTGRCGIAKFGLYVALDRHSAFSHRKLRSRRAMKSRRSSMWKYRASGGTPDVSRSGLQQSRRDSAIILP